MTFTGEVCMALHDLIQRIEELDNPGDEGISSLDPMVEHAKKTLAYLKIEGVWEPPEPNQPCYGEKPHA